jgi:formylmethanofuran dehydrogenase subunit E
MRPIVRLLSLITVFGLFTTTAANAETGEVAYRSGGVGHSSQEAMLAVQNDYSLKLVFAQEGGAFLAQVEVRISAADGTVVLTTTTDGPWLLVDLPAGEYAVAATYREQTEELRVQVPASGLKQVTMRW